MVVITKIPRRRVFDDYTYTFSGLQNLLPIDSIWINMKRHMFTRKVSSVFAGPQDSVLLSPFSEFYPYSYLIRNNQIEFRVSIPIPFININIEEQSFIFLALQRDLPNFAMEGFLTQIEVNEILDFFRPLLEILKIDVKDFIYYLERDWNYKVHFSFPSSWGEAYQEGDFTYGTKYRAATILMFLFKLSPSSFGAKWHNYSSTEIARRQASGLKSTRVLRIDANNQIRISATMAMGRRKGIADFSSFSFRFPSQLDLADIRQKTDMRGYATRMVSKIGD